jgi:hypothetical protein
LRLDGWVIPNPNRQKELFLVFIVRFIAYQTVHFKLRISLSNSPFLNAYFGGFFIARDCTALHEIARPCTKLHEVALGQNHTQASK